MQLFLCLVGCVPVLTTPPGAGDDTGGDWVVPSNSWGVEIPPDDLEGEGLAEGEVAPDFRLDDQFGAEVSLWQFYGSVIVLDVSTMWCSPCQKLARGAQAIADAYRDQGFVYVTLLSQDLGSDVPDQAELQSWGDSFDLTEPILADNAGYSDQVVPDGAFPGVLLIGRDMRVIGEIDPATDETIIAAVEDAL
jgi:thiol-disulfide isomerase/thioredoxin